MNKHVYDRGLRARGGRGRDGNEVDGWSDQYASCTCVKLAKNENN